jgi:hypothetical protein
MKHALIACIIALSLFASCSGNDSQHDHNNGTHTHDDGTVHKNHDENSTTQEEFIVTDSTQTHHADSSHSHDHTHPH